MAAVQCCNTFVISLPACQSEACSIRNSCQAPSCQLASPACRTAFHFTISRQPSGSQCRIPSTRFEPNAESPFRFPRLDSLPGSLSNALARREAGGIWQQRRVLAAPILAAAASANVATADDYYEILGVSRDAEQAELKRAYRKLALQYHPDVSSEPDANDKFVKLSAAYDVLIDAEQRAIYDKFGVEGLSGRVNKSAGAATEVWDSWQEFKPHQRKTRKGDAREAAAAASAAGTTEPGGGLAVAQMGDVVEYPLSEATKARLQDGRSKGIGFVVGRNIDRGDRHKLPPENLELVELEPLYREEGSEQWLTDPLESAAFASLSHLRVLRSEFDRRTDSWRLLDELSEGCGSPVYEEEIIL